MWHHFAIGCSLVSLITAAKAADLPAIRSLISSDAPSMSIVGEANQRFKPDVATLSLEAVDERTTSADAALENARLGRILTDKLQKYGLAGADVIAGPLKLDPQYQERRNPKSGEVVSRKFTAYRASTTFQAKIRNVNDAPRIARDIVSDGSNVYRDLSFDISDREERLSALRARALKDALSHAQTYAQAASLTLGDIVQIAPVEGRPAPVIESAAGVDERSHAAVSVPAHVDDVVLALSVRVAWELKTQSTLCGAKK